MQKTTPTVARSLKPAIDAAQDLDPRLKHLYPGSYCPLHQVPEVNREWPKISQSLRLTLLDLIVAEKPWPLMLLGQAGSGKTRATLCMWDHFGGAYVTLPGLHQRLQDVRNGLVYWPGPTGSRVDVTEFWSHWHGLSLAIIDEIGLREANDAQYDTLKRAIDERQEQPAIFISNLDMAGLARMYDLRVVSRLNEATVVTLKGDRRQA